MMPGAGGAYRGRYAPSPSGWLHLGNARTALLAWLRARSRGGVLVLRVDDLDGPRTLPEAVDGNLRELAWLFSRGVPLEDLDHLACTCGSWSGFFSAAHERLCGEVLDPSRPRPACAPSEKETESGRE